MKITISKILNKTDLAESGSHGGLVVTKPMINPLTDFLKKLGWIGILKIRMTEKFFNSLHGLHFKWNHAK